MEWYTRVDLNHRHLLYKNNALTPELLVFDYQG